MKKLYIIRDSVSHQCSMLNIEESDETFIRSFGMSFAQQRIPSSLAKDFEGVCVGEIDYPDGTYPRVRGYECPVPIVTGDVAMAPYLQEANNG